MSSLPQRLVRGAHTWIKRLDRADLPLLRRVPSRWKRGLVATFFRLAAPLAARGTRGPRLSAPSNRHYLEVLAGRHEPEVLALLQRELAPGMTVLDVGANIGYFTIHMARLVGPGGRVWALEPSPDNLVHLLANVARHGEGRVQVLATAAGRERRTAALQLREDSRRTALGTGSGGTLEVPVIPLDELFGGPRAEAGIHLVKIDTEGADLEVLQGMEGLLRDHPRLRLVVEWHPERLQLAGQDPDALPDFLLRHGFEVFTMAPDGSRTPFRREAFTGGYLNLYAVRPGEGSRG